MSAIKTRSNLLSDLARAKALFQQRSVTAYLGQMPPGSKHAANCDVDHALSDHLRGQPGRGEGDEE